jgi:hypothetical protein
MARGLAQTDTGSARPDDVVDPHAQIAPFLSAGAAAETFAGAMDPIKVAVEMNELLG